MKCLRADLVVLANSHNPSILSPDWLRKHCDFDEEPAQFVHTPDFSMFDSSEVQIILDQARMQIVCKRFDPDLLDTISAIARRYVENLPHIPYVAIGINFIWQCKGLEVGKSDISVSFWGKPVPTSLHDYETFCGGIVYGKHEDHRMKLTVEVPSSKEISFNFNFHYEVKGKTIAEIVSIFGGYRGKANTSKAMILELVK